MINQILSAIDDETLGNTEISKPGALVIQYRDYRIAITRPPFSELLEMTIVHPIKQMSLEDYQLSEKLMSRLEKQAEGILFLVHLVLEKVRLHQELQISLIVLEKLLKHLNLHVICKLIPGVTQYTRLGWKF